MWIEYSTKTEWVQGAFGQYPWAHSVILGDGAVEGWELDLMILTDPFQLSMISVILCVWVNINICMWQQLLHLQSSIPFFPLQIFHKI